jgi:hypothetical protein
MKKNEMGGACSTYGRQARCIQDLGGETLGKKDLLEDLKLDGIITLN